MILTTDQTNAANAAITNLQAALSTYAGLGTSAKDLYAGGTIFPLVSASLALCVTLGNTLAAEQQANADAALTPFEEDPIRTQIVVGLLAFRSISNQTKALYLSGPNPATAIDSARLTVTIFQTVLAYMAAEAAAQAAIVSAAVAAAQAAITASSAQPVIVGAAVQAALAAAGVSSSEATAAGAAVQAALA